MKEGATKLREKLNNKDNESVESIKQAADEFQRQSLKLFETAYKKVCVQEILLISEICFFLDAI